jgi:hypothetical protein
MPALLSTENPSTKSINGKKKSQRIVPPIYRIFF